MSDPSTTRSPAPKRGSGPYYAHLHQLLDQRMVISRIDDLWVSQGYDAVIDFYALAVARIESECPAELRNLFGVPDTENWNTLHADPDSDRAFLTALKVTPLHENRYGMDSQEALRIAEAQTRRMFIVVRDWKTTIDQALRAEHADRPKSDPRRPDPAAGTALRPNPAVRAIIRNRAAQIAATHGDDVDMAQTDFLWASLFFHVLYRNLCDQIERALTR